MLSAEIQELVDRNISGTDILHGYLKQEMLEAEQHLDTAKQIEEDNDFSDAMESMERTYAEGFVDALTMVNSLVIDLTYALEERARG
jgi:hypothetical protein